MIFRDIIFFDCTQANLDNLFETFLDFFVVKARKYCIIRHNLLGGLYWKCRINTSFTPYHFLDIVVCRKRGYNFLISKTIILVKEGTNNGVCASPILRLSKAFNTTYEYEIPTVSLKWCLLLESAESKLRKL